MRILLSDGAGLASRQVAGLLARAGHDVGVLSPGGLALSRWTRSVRRHHRVPAFGPDPRAWLAAALRTCTEHRYDLLLPTQEQVAALSAGSAEVAAAGVRTVVPPFPALAAVQDKASATATLARLGLPQPPTAVLADRAALAAWDRFPVFLKRPIATASTGVRRVDDAAGARAVVEEWGLADPFPDGGLVAQVPAPGPLAMAQAVATGGELVAFAVNERVAEGAGGGSSRKVSLDRPDVREVLAALAADLGWHGALSADLILTPDGPVAIDVNPRLVEPANAALAGVDLVGAMVALGRGERPDPQPPGCPGVATHQAVVAVLGAAQHGGRRRDVAREAVAALARRGPYRGSVEELTPVRGDRRTGLPVAAAVAATLVHPGAWTWFAGGSVSAYALSPEGWQALVAHAAGPGCAR